MRRGSWLPFAGPIAFAVLAGLLVPARAVATSHAPVALIVMENQSFGSTDPGVDGDTTRYIVGNPDTPYINGTLIPSGTLYTNYHALGPVSLPNYLDMTAGTDGGCTTNSCPPDSFPQENLFHLLGEAGVPFASFIGGMPGKCPSGTTYPSLRHNPEAYFTNVDASTGLPYACPITDIPLPSTLPNPLPTFTLIAPSNCNNMHGAAATSSCPAGTDAIIQAGDTWLSNEVPALLQLGATVVVTFDEGSSLDTSGGGGHVVTIVVGPDVPAGAVNDTPLNHFGLLAGIERSFGLTPLLEGAATATPIQIPDGPAPPTPQIANVTPSSGGSGTTVRIIGTSLGTAGSVDFGGVPAAFTIPSDAEIDALVPIGATGGPITVSTRGGSAQAAFTVEQSGRTLVQHTSSLGTSTAPHVTLSTSTVAGDLLVAAVAWKGTAALSAPAGWQKITVTNNLALYASVNAPAQGPTISFSLSGSNKWVMQASEWSGLAAVDVSAHASSLSASGSLATTGTTASTTAPAELAFAAVSAMAAVSESAPTGGFALLDLASNAKAVTLGSYVYMTSATGPQSTSVTLSPAAKWRGVIGTFE